MIFDTFGNYELAWRIGPRSVSWRGWMQIMFGGPGRARPAAPRTSAQLSAPIDLLETRNHGATSANQLVRRTDRRSDLNR
jgi:hypothetical protein